MTFDTYSSIQKEDFKFSDFTDTQRALVRWIEVD